MPNPQAGSAQPPKHPQPSNDSSQATVQNTRIGSISTDDMGTAVREELEQIDTECNEVWESWHNDSEQGFTSRMTFERLTADTLKLHRYAQKLEPMLRERDGEVGKDVEESNDFVLAVMQAVEDYWYDAHPAVDASLTALKGQFDRAESDWGARRELLSGGPTADDLAEHQARIQGIIARAGPFLPRPAPDSEPTPASHPDQLFAYILHARLKEHLTAVEKASESGIGAGPVQRSEEPVPASTATVDGPSASTLTLWDLLRPEAQDKLAWIHRVYGRRNPDLVPSFAAMNLERTTSSDGGDSIGESAQARSPAAQFTPCGDQIGSQDPKI